MSLSVDVVEQVLLARGYLEKKRTRSKVAYQRGADLPLYLNLKSAKGTTVLVAHPQSAVQSLHIDGVAVGEKYFHSSNMGLFPKRLNKGATLRNYGVGLTFDGSAALVSCLEFLEHGLKAGVIDAALGADAKSNGNAHALRDDANDAMEGLAGQGFSEKKPMQDDAVLALAPGQDVSVQATRRVGHDSFRSALEHYWGGICAISGVSHAGLLRASHIKPWAASSPQEQTNPFNGLLLAVQWDAAFDRGLITLNDNGEVVLSPQLAATDAAVLGIAAGMRLRKPLLTEHFQYLAYHRKHVFLEGATE